MFAVLILSAWICVGCVGTVVGAATDVAIEAAKVPFKVGGAIKDGVSKDDDEE